MCTLIQFSSQNDSFLHKCLLPIILLSDYEQRLKRTDLFLSDFVPTEYTGHFFHSRFWAKSCFQPQPTGTEYAKLLSSWILCILFYDCMQNIFSTTVFTWINVFQILLKILSGHWQYLSNFVKPSLKVRFSDFCFDQTAVKKWQQSQPIFLILITPIQSFWNWYNIFTQICFYQIFFCPAKIFLRY